VITKAALTKALKKPSGLSYQAAALCIDVLLETLVEGLARGETVELRGFGVFGVKTVKARKAGFSGQIVPPHGHVTFRPGRKLHEAVWNFKG
jgi:nucleoid DNA-binding protein